MGEMSGYVLPLLAIGAWLNHVVTCATHAWWGFLIAGAIFFPVAVVHGIINWWQSLIG